jgi:uncharacterized CHY-type Zn-finger protein
VHGPVVDDETRCIHYRTPLDVVAIRFACCGEYYPCHLCHDETADHPSSPWPAGSDHELAVLCGWLVASLIPASEKEEQLAASAKEAAQPLVHEVTDAARQVASDLKEPAQNAAESVKNTAQDAAATVKEEATDRANDVAGEARESAQRMQGDSQ